MSFEKNSFPRNYSLFIIAVLIIIYLINCFTTFRLGNDVIRYFKIKEWLENGAVASKNQDNLPLGFPCMLVALSKFNLCKSVFICFINNFYLSGSLYFVMHLLNIKRQFPVLIIALLFNWAILKNVITPLSDAQYMFLSTGSLYFLERYFFDRKIKDIVLALILCALAIFTRVIGICLLLSFIFSLLKYHKKSLKDRENGVPVKIALLSLFIFFFLFIFFSPLFHIPEYMRLGKPYWTGGVFVFFVTTFKIHLMDWGEVVINTSLFKVNFLYPAVLTGIFLVSGLLSMLYFLLNLYRNRNKIPVQIIVYLCIYIFIVFCWPTLDARFWVPVLPLMAGIFIKYIYGKNHIERYLIAIWKCVYIISGTIALSYYTYLTFNKKEFSARHDNGIWKKTYEIYFFGQKSEKEEADESFPLYLLEKYDR